MFKFKNTEPSIINSSVFNVAEPSGGIATINLFIDNTEDDSYRTMAESMSALYHAVSCNDMEIALEGLGDMLKSACEFFKTIIKKIAAFIKNTFYYLMSYVTDFEKFIDRYKENIQNFKEFEVNGYTYTIDSQPIDSSGITNIINQYNKNIKTINSKEYSDIQTMISKEMGKESLGKLRSTLCGKTSGFIRPEKFIDEMNKRFRNGKTSTSNIKVNSGTVNSFIDEFKRCKAMLPDVKEDGYNVQSVLDDMEKFFYSLPKYEYVDSDDKRIKHYKLSTDLKKGDFTADESDEEGYSTEYYKKLTAYYNFCYRMCREIAGMYTKAYTTKIEAIKEAISFYTSVIRKAISPFNERETDSVKSSKESVSIIQDGYTDWMTEYGLNAFKGEELSTHERIKAFNELKAIVKTTNTSFKSEIQYGGENCVAIFKAAGRGDAEKDAKNAVRLANSKSKDFVYSIPKPSFFNKGILVNYIWVYAKHKKKMKLQESVGIIPAMENLPKIHVGDVDDYSIQAMEAMHEIEVAKWDAHFREYLDEIDVLAEGYRRGYILMEDVEVKEKSGQDAKESTFSKIIEFIHTIIAKFMDKASNLFNSNQEWFDKYSGKLNEVNAEAYDNIKITMLAYHKQNKYDIPRTSVSPDDARLGTEKFKTLGEVAELMYPGICKLSATKDITEGTKIYFRGGSNTVETYSNGADVKKQVTMMVEWCKEYTDTCHHIKDQIDKMTEEMEKMDKAYEASKEASYSYVLSEQALLEETGLAWLPFIDSKGNAKFLVLKEAEGDANKEKANKEKKEGQDAAKAAGATVANDDKKETKPETEEERKAREKKEADDKKAKDDKISRALAAKYYYQVKVKVATAMLTIAEERFVSYIKTLRNVVALAHIAADKAEKPDKAKK